jgi:hypothetical protein
MFCKPQAEYRTSEKTTSWKSFPSCPEARQAAYERHGARIPKIEFLNLNLSLLLYDIQSPFYWPILKKTILYSGFKNTEKKIRKTRNSSYP